MKKLTTIEEEICEIIAKYYPYTQLEIEDVYDKVLSYDMTIDVLEIHTSHNCGFDEAISIVSILNTKDCYEKGKNEKGEKLNESNLNAGIFVIWRNKKYETGNRRHHQVELYINRKFIRTASMNHISICKNQK